MDGKLFQLIFVGAVVLDNETPRVVENICREWFDGTSSQMYRFIQREPVDPIKLVKEAIDCRHETDDEDEKIRIQKVIDWAYSKHKLHLAVVALRDANEEFIKAAKKAELDEFDTFSLQKMAVGIE
jgi:hypothetical protein